MSDPKCPPVGTLPDDYSKLLPKGVPPVERAPTSMPVDPKQAKTYGPAEVTWYFPIDLPKTNPTAVFLPKNFAFGKDIDVILYFHGNKIVGGNRDFTNIDQYLNGKVGSVSFRDDINTAGKQAVLICPTMGDFPGRGLGGNDDLGVFGTGAGGTCFLEHVMAWLGKYEFRYSQNGIVPKVRNLVLAGHSGGGNPIHVLMEPMKAKICEIWCFDVVLGSTSDWLNWAVFNPTKTMTFFHAVQSTPSYNDLVQKKADHEKKTGKPLTNLVLNDIGGGHYPALVKNFGGMVKASKAFA